ncbi:MAG: hypothetical protein NTV30_07045 [Chloroflexi bacterium]|nr:hypothetical protein [Chloroflexota bacterium]
MVFIYLISITVFFRQILIKQFSLTNQTIMIILFGGVAIFSSYAGTKLPSGAISNTRDLAPMIAGLIGGPIVGLGAGLVGGLHRYFVIGGFVAIPCSMATILSGIIGGVIYVIRKKVIIGIWQATLTIVIMELVHMGLILLIAEPYSSAFAVVKAIIAPMVIGNGLGMLVSMFIIHSTTNYLRYTVKELKDKAY